MLVRGICDGPGFLSLLIAAAIRRVCGEGAPKTRSPNLCMLGGMLMGPGFVYKLPSSVPGPLSERPMMTTGKFAGGGLAVTSVAILLA